ncbi:hypothetical protein M8542_36875 [Amycolatopsis sp. OK19-0408]|uniref:Uncharacterized protein n=1 Tax=Amycolatopsis iheyensis TaxID=2945988 RepID=A0A9X2NLB4_9PSEU|nr:hypothetical protein [Amycolatopsis iheyensis]MCR6488417.1 hypothetical protein [Amycolatopsis iheyensis]
MVSTDRLFFGLAPEFFEGDGTRLLTDVANWADLCTAPRGAPVQHPESGINNQVYEKSVLADGSPLDNRPANLPMPDVTIGRFFAAAHAVSGPDIDLFGAAGAPHALLQAACLNLGSNLTNKAGGGADPAGGLMGLHDALERLFENWQGSAAEACKDYAGSLYTFMAHELEVMAGLVDVLTAYCATVKAARRRLIGLMQAFVAAMRAKEAEDVANAQQFPWGLVAAALATVVGLGFGLAGAIEAAVIAGTEVSTTGAASVLLPPLASMAATTADKMLDSGTKYIPATDYAVAAKTYLHMANQVVEDVRSSTASLTQQVTDMLDGFMDPPPPPLTKVKFEADPHALEPAP